MDREFQSLLVSFCANDDLFDNCSKDHLLQRRRATITLPNCGVVLTHPANPFLSFSFSFQRRSNSAATSRFLASAASYCSNARAASYFSCSSLLDSVACCATSPALNTAIAFILASIPNGEITFSNSCPSRRSTA